MHIINPIYDYKSLSRESVEGKRLYQLPDGSKVHSVTTILDATADKSGIYRWQKAVGMKKATEIKVEAANRGTAMHTSLEKYVKKLDRTPGSNLVHQIGYKMADTIIGQGLEPYLDEVWGNEVSLFNPGLYAGTTDLVGVYSGQPAIVDFKQSNKPKAEEHLIEYKLQLCAYADAHNAMFGTKIKRVLFLSAHLSSSFNASS